jgi:hypothetical protein
MALKGFSQLGESTVTNDVVENLMSYLSWGLLQAGNFTNVTIPTTGVYSGLDHVLTMVPDSGYDRGQVWGGFRKDWVWESGVGALVSTDDSSPGVSGVYVDNTFYDTSTTGTYSHFIDHPNGRVVFDSAIATSAAVHAEFSYKTVTIQRANGLPWFAKVQADSERSDKAVPNELPQNRIQLPVIGIEVIPGRNFEGYQLGGGSYCYTDLLIHCVAETDYERDHLVDIVSFQNQKDLRMYNLNTIVDSGALPLDYRGVPASGAGRFPDLQADYPGKLVRIFDMRTDAIYTLGSFHVGSVKCRTEVVLDV